MKETREIIWKGNEHTNSNDRGGIVPVAIVNHISAGTMSSMDNWFRSPGNQVSSAHFGVAKDGRIHQYVKIERMAWANGLKTDRIPFATAPIVKDIGINPNLYTVSIEHEGTDGELTEEQFQASVWLHRYIRQYVRETWGKEIPFDEYHVIGHFQIDPVRKPNCPGPKFPWSRLYKALKNEEDEDDMAIKAEDWFWKQAYNILGKAYNEGKIDWQWCQKVLDRTLTAGEYTHVLAVINARAQGIDVDAENPAGVEPGKR